MSTPISSPPVALHPPTLPSVDKGTEKPPPSKVTAEATHAPQAQHAEKPPLEPKLGGDKPVQVATQTPRAEATTVPVLKPHEKNDQAAAHFAPGGSKFTELTGHGDLALTDHAKVKTLFESMVRGHSGYTSGDISPEHLKGMAQAAVDQGKFMTLASSPVTAPKSMKIPDTMNTGFQAHWNNSFPGGTSCEQGGTLVFNDKGHMEMILPETGVSGSVSTNYDIPSGSKLLGSFHTHPYDASEGNHTDVSFSGGDFLGTINCNEKFGCVQSGAKQFMMARTDQTPPQITSEDSDKIDSLLSKKLGEGMSPKDASQHSAIEACKLFKMAYYEGTGGNFTRVWPA